MPENGKNWIRTCTMEKKLDQLVEKAVRLGAVEAKLIETTDIVLNRAPS